VWAQASRSAALQEHVFHCSISDWSWVNLATPVLNRGSRNELVLMRLP
jgi:hypothetical protein